MNPGARTARAVDLDVYLTLFAPYEAQLRDFGGRERDYGGRFALLFRQIVGLLVQDAEINRLVPQTYVAVAERFLDRVPDTVRHFSYEDNRHFFLSELRDWIAVQERGREMRNARRESALETGAASDTDRQ
jgi:hypothetical protein